MHADPDHSKISRCGGAEERGAKCPNKRKRNGNTYFDRGGVGGFFLELFLEDRGLIDQLSQFNLAFRCGGLLFLQLLELFSELINFLSLLHQYLDCALDSFILDVIKYLIIEKNHIKIFKALLEIGILKVVQVDAVASNPVQIINFSLEVVLSQERCQEVDIPVKHYQGVNLRSWLLRVLLLLLQLVLLHINIIHIL